MEVEKLTTQKPSELKSGLKSEPISIPEGKKAVAFKTKDGRDVNFHANAARKPSEVKKEQMKKKIIQEYERQKKRDAREEKKKNRMSVDYSK